jgi:2'-5' RNA ligase
MNRGHRLFFALVPDAGVQKGIEQVQNGMRVTGRAAKPHQFHATLAFLGMQQPERVPEIREVASRLSFESCKIVMDSIGCFRRAGVLWLGASRIPDPLMQFQHKLVGALLDAGIGHDRKAWKFHITLYRKLRMPSPIMDPVAIEWCLGGFDLIESVSIRSGVEYHSIGHWQAQSGGDLSGEM